MVLCFGSSAVAESINIVPIPTQAESRPGQFTLSANTRIFSGDASPEQRAVATMLAAQLSSAVGSNLKVIEGLPTEDERNLIAFFPPPAKDERGPESYELDIRPNAIAIKALTPAGAFYATQSLRQLLPPETLGSPRKGGSSTPDKFTIPCLLIKDEPRYGHRGMLLDCGRHFMSPDFVKRYIDLLALHKMNVLHWHLTEDQGWRIEIKKYPKLTEIGAWRKATRDSEQPRDDKGRYGGFYSQAEIKDIVAYAKSRFITIIPEIEMPGHSQAALASYPELSCTGGPFEVGTQWGVIDDVYCAGNDRTFEILQDILGEVCDLFPGTFIHIGGDECPKERWKKCPKCQARIKAEGLKDEHELQSYFIRRIEKFLNSKGKRLIGWDEILEGGLAPNATVQSWRGMDGAIAAATSNHDVISSPTSHCYLDYAQSQAPGEPTNMGFIPLERVYEFEPTPAKLSADQARHVLGLEGNIWTEHAPQKRVDWQVFPRLCAIAEIGWSPASTRNWTDFEGRMKPHYRRLDALGVTYFVPPPTFSKSPAGFADSLDVELKPGCDGAAVFYTRDGSEPTAGSLKPNGPIHLTKTTTIKALTQLGNGRSSTTASVTYKKQTPHESLHVDPVQPGLDWTLYRGKFQKLPEFSKTESTTHGSAFTNSAQKDDTQNWLFIDSNEDFALRFSGFIDVPKDGTYTFYLTSDDGSRLTIADEVVVDADGLHPPSEFKGSVILKTGKHPFVLEYFQAGGAKKLDVAYEGPGLPRQPIPPVAFWRRGAENSPFNKKPQGLP